jgi:hypothetical protein
MAAPDGSFTLSRISPVGRCAGIGTAAPSSSKQNTAIPLLGPPRSESILGIFPAPPFCSGYFRVIFGALTFLEQHGTKCVNNSGKYGIFNVNGWSDSAVVPSIDWCFAREQEKG